MAKLPNRGVLVDQDGNLQWAWEHNGEEGFEALPPLRVENAVSGKVSQVVFHPSWQMLDLEDLVPAGDTHLLYSSDRGETKFRKHPKTGQWQVKQVVSLHDHETGELHTEEIDHPLLPVIHARKRLRARIVAAKAARLTGNKK